MLGEGINLACFFRHLCTFQHLLPFKVLLPSCRLLGSETRYPTLTTARWHLKAAPQETQGWLSHPQPTFATFTSASSYLLSHLLLSKCGLSPKPRRRFFGGRSLWSSPSKAYHCALPTEGPSETFTISWELLESKDGPYSPLPTKPPMTPGGCTMFVQ